MGADGAYLRSFLTHADVAAVAADPNGFLTGLEHQVVQMCIRDSR